MTVGDGLHSETLKMDTWMASVTVYSTWIFNLSHLLIGVLILISTTVLFWGLGAVGGCVCRGWFGGWGLGVKGGVEKRSNGLSTNFINYYCCFNQYNSIFFETILSILLQLLLL